MQSLADQPNTQLQEVLLARQIYHNLKITNSILLGSSGRSTALYFLTVRTLLRSNQRTLLLPPISKTGRGTRSIRIVTGGGSSHYNADTVDQTKKKQPMCYASILRMLPDRYSFFCLFLLLCRYTPASDIGLERYTLISCF